MLSERDQQTLARIEAEVGLADPRFAEGLQRGRPCAPREFRRLRWRVAALAVAVVLWALIGWALAGGGRLGAQLAAVGAPVVLTAMAWAMLGLARRY